VHAFVHHRFIHGHILLWTSPTGYWHTAEYLIYLFCVIVRVFPYFPVKVGDAYYIRVRIVFEFLWYLFRVIAPLCVLSCLCDEVCFSSVLVSLNDS